MRQEIKQEITKEQWDELTEEQQQILRKFFPTISSQMPIWMHLNIGQLIEFIQNHSHFVRTHRKVTSNGDHVDWQVWADDYSVFKCSELCDALFAAMKEILEDKIKETPILAGR